MANPVKGEVAFEAESGVYTLVLDFNALCEIEKALGGLVFEGPSAIRTVFHIGMKRRHKLMTLEQAGDLIGEIGTAKAGAVLAEAMAAAGLSGGEDEGSSPQKAA